LRPPPRSAGNSLAPRSTSNLRRVAGDRGPPRPNASGWIEEVESSIVDIAWSLARMTRKTATKWPPAADPNAPTRLKIRPGGLGTVCGRARRTGVRIGKMSRMDTIVREFFNRECFNHRGVPISCTLGAVDSSRRSTRKFQRNLISCNRRARQCIRMDAISDS
jgi:hypothetical protein